MESPEQSINQQELAEEGTITEEQMDASTDREKRLKALGEAGHLRVHWSEKDGVRRPYEIFVKIGEDNIFLRRSESSSMHGDKSIRYVRYSGEISRMELSPEEARKLWIRFRDVPEDLRAQSSELSADFSMQEWHLQYEKDQLRQKELSDKADLERQKQDAISRVLGEQQGPTE